MLTMLEQQLQNGKLSPLLKLKKTLTASFYPVVIIVALTIGFFSGKMYNSYLNKINEKHYKQPINHKDISIAINERNELLIIDRVSGEYKTYQDSVGRGIFDMYSKIVFLSKTDEK